jgi:hypothetical protein
MQFNTNVARKRTAVAPAALFDLKVKNSKDLQRYFEYSQSGVDVVEDGLKEVSFGEYLVDQQVLSRFQLFRALQMQDRLPGVRLGECAAALGYAPIAQVERLYAAFARINTVMV